MEKLNKNQTSESDNTRVSQSNSQSTQPQFSDSQSAEKRQSSQNETPPPKQNILNDATSGRDSKQLENGRQLSLMGGVSAIDRLLGLDLRPTTAGILVAPPGNQEFLRHLSPTNRRTIMRKMLNKQRGKMRRLARYLRDQKDENDSNNRIDQETFLEVVAEKFEIDRNQIQRATNELDKAARMLDILDEMLAMQDYTISQIGSFSQG